MNLSPLAAMETTKMTTSSAEENFIKMTTFPFKWYTWGCHAIGGYDVRGSYQSAKPDFMSKPNQRKQSLEHILWDILYHHAGGCDHIIMDSVLIHYSDVIISATVSQITSVSSVCSTICSGADQRKHQSSASLAFVRGTKGQWCGKNTFRWRHHDQL